MCKIDWLEGGERSIYVVMTSSEASFSGTDEG